MSKQLGYTFYPKDWRSNMNVQELTLKEKGFYRELIDECYIQNSDKITLKCKTFARIQQLNARSLATLITKLDESLLIVCPNFDQTSEEVEILIPSVSARLGIITSASNGGKISKALGNQNATKKPTKEKLNIKDKENIKEFTPPNFEEIKSYFIEKGYSIQSAKKAYDYYEAANWKDSKGNQVKNWKQKMIGVWFKDENKQMATGPVKRKAKGYNEQGQVIDQFGEVIS